MHNNVDVKNRDKRFGFPRILQINKCRDRTSIRPRLLASKLSLILLGYERYRQVESEYILENSKICVYITNFVKILSFLTFIQIFGHSCCNLLV